MANNSIGSKLGLCGDCEDGILKSVIGGRRDPQRGSTLWLDGLCKRHHDTHKYRQQSDKKKIQQKSQPKIIGLKEWFDDKIKIVDHFPYCMEHPEDFIPEEYRHASIAHIFPKSIFPSVATHPVNYLILSAGNGSHDKTHRLDTFSKMRVWPIAVERFKVLEPDITEKHKYLTLFKSYIV